MRLFYVPHAGSTSMSYMSFRLFLDPEIKNQTLELAGRGERTQEARYHDIRECADDLFWKNRSLFEEEDYALFAHSVGTLFAYEMIKIIQREGVRMPKHVFFSGRKAPYLKVDLGCDLEHITDEDVMNYMKRCGGIPVVLSEHEELMKRTLEILKDDLVMSQKYQEELGDFVMDCDISVLYGENDPYSSSDMMSWEDCTSRSCTIYPFSGGHFYYNTHKKEVGDLISRILREV